MYHFSPDVIAAILVPWNKTILMISFNYDTNMAALSFVFGTSRECVKTKNTKITIITGVMVQESNATMVTMTMNFPGENEIIEPCSKALNIKK